MKKVLSIFTLLSLVICLSTSTIGAECVTYEDGTFYYDSLCTYRIDEEKKEAIIININDGIKKLDIPETIICNDASYPVTAIYIEYHDVYSFFYERLETINVSKNIESIIINIDPYSDFNSLKTINIPSGAKLAELALPYCPKLKKINIPTDSALTYLHISGCPKLKKLLIPKNLKSLSIGEDAPQLKIKVAKGNKYLKVKDNQILLNNGKVLYGIIGKKSNVTICSSVTKVKYISNKYVKKVTIPASVKNIKNYSFSYCKNLSKVKIGNKKKSPKIKADAFKYTKKGIKFYVKNKKVAKSLKKQLKGSGVKKAKIYIGKTLIYKNVK